jgi:NADH:ubiquinone oxidoreductase subunit
MAANHGNIWNTWPTYREFTRRFFADVQKYGWREMFQKYLKYDVVRVGGNLVGTDHFGNKYFENTEYKLEPLQRRYRWVEFAAKDWDASHVTPEWHGWLSYTHDIVPGTPEAQALIPRYRMDPIPNMTGSESAYFPPNAMGSPAHIGPVAPYREFNPADPTPPFDVDEARDVEYDDPKHPASI